MNKTIQIFPYLWIKLIAMYNSIRSIINQSSVQGEKNSILKGLVWPVTIIAIVGVVMFVLSLFMTHPYSLCLFILGVLFVGGGVSCGIVLYYVIYFKAFNKDPNLLRSEKLIKTLAILDKINYIGDSSSVINDLLTEPDTEIIQIDGINEDKEEQGQ